MWAAAARGAHSSLHGHALIPQELAWQEVEDDQQSGEDGEAGDFPGVVARRRRVPATEAELSRRLPPDRRAQPAAGGGGTVMVRRRWLAARVDETLLMPAEVAARLQTALVQAIQGAQRPTPLIMLAGVNKRRSKAPSQALQEARAFEEAAYRPATTAQAKASLPDTVLKRMSLDELRQAALDLGITHVNVEPPKAAVQRAGAAGAPAGQQQEGAAGEEGGAEGVGKARERKKQGKKASSSVPVPKRRPQLKVCG
jgi:hypothetical protein